MKGALSGRYQSGASARLVNHIQAEHAEGRSLGQIARDLNAAEHQQRTAARNGGHRPCVPYSGALKPDASVVPEPQVSCRREA
jgi:hypothetical protein